MKKATKIFSFIAIALCAFMLFGSVGNYKQASADAGVNISKVIRLSELKSLDFANKNYYIEFGEYPQSLITGTERTTIAERLNALREAGGSVISSDTRKYQQPNSCENEYMSYDSETGYYTLKQAVGKYPVGTKIAEFVSGLDAYYKYNNYKVDSNGTPKQISATGDDVRSLSIQTISKSQNFFNLMAVNAPNDYSRRYLKHNGYYVHNERPFDYHGHSGNKQGWLKSDPYYHLVNYRHSTANGFDAGTQYLFLVEPIKWRITGVSGNNLTLQSDLIIDSCYYNLYANAGTDYGYSYLRNWLNYDTTKSHLSTEYQVFMPSEQIDAGKSYDGGRTTVFLTNNIPITADGLPGTVGADIQTADHFHRSDWHDDALNAHWRNPEDTLSARRTVLSTYSTKRSFFNMAFDASEREVMQTVKSAYYSGNHNVYDVSGGKTISDKVMVPSSTSSVKLGNAGYTDYAIATGLIYKLGSGLGNTYEALNSTSTYSGNNGLFWTSDMGGRTWSRESVYNPKTGGTTSNIWETVFVYPSMFSTVGGTTTTTMIVGSSNSRLIVNSTDTNGDKMEDWASQAMPDQSGGVIPVIKVDISKLAEGKLIRAKSSSNTISVNGAKAVLGVAASSSEGADNNINLRKSQNPDNITFFFTDINLTDNTDIAVESYKIDKSAKTITVDFNDAAKTCLSSAGNYIFINVCPVTYRSKSIYNGGVNHYFPNFEYDYNYELYPIVYAISATALDANGKVTLTFNKTMDNVNFNIFCNVVTDNEQNMQYIANSYMARKSFQYYTNENRDSLETMYMIEGESYTFPTDGKVLNGNTEVSQSWWYTTTGNYNKSTKATSIEYTRAGLVINDPVNGDVPVNNSNLRFYTDYAGDIMTISNGATSIAEHDVFFYLSDSEGKELEFKKALQNGSATVYLAIKYQYAFDVTVDAGKTRVGEIAKIFGFNNKTILNDPGKEYVEYRGARNIYFNTSDESRIYKGIILEFNLKNKLISAGDVSITTENGVLALWGGNKETMGQYIKLNTYSLQEETTYISFTGVTENKGVLQEISDKSPELTQITGISYDSDFNVDLKLNNGYYISINEANGKREIDLPDMTFKYPALVVDNDGYRMSKIYNYEENYGFESYRNSNVRLNNDGYRLDFDDQGNLKYYFEFTNNSGIPTASSLAIVNPSPTATTISVWDGESTNEEEVIAGSYYAVPEEGNTSNKYAYYFIPRLSLYTQTGNANFVLNETFPKKFTGSNDCWEVYDAAGNLLTSKLKISKNLESIQYTFAENSNNLTMYMTAYYDGYYYDSQANNGSGAYIKIKSDNTSGYGGQFDSTADGSLRYKFIITEEAGIEAEAESVLAISPVTYDTGDARTFYTPWIEYVSNSITDIVTLTQSSNGVFKATVNSGSAQNLWNGVAYNWYYTDANGVAQRLDVAIDNGPRVYHDKTGNGYTTDDEKVDFNFKGNYHTDKSYHTITIDGEGTYRVYAVEGIGAQLVYFTEDVQEYNLFDSLEAKNYSKNNIAIRLNFKNIIGDIVFGFQEPAKYEYEFNFNVDLNKWTDTGYDSDQEGAEAHKFNIVDQIIKAPDYKLFARNGETYEYSNDEALKAKINGKTIDEYLSTFTNGGYNSEGVEIRRYIPLVYEEQEYYFAPSYALKDGANITAPADAIYSKGGKILQFAGWRISETSWNDMNIQSQVDFFNGFYSKTYTGDNYKDIINKYNTVSADITSALEATPLTTTAIPNGMELSNGKIAYNSSVASWVIPSIDSLKDIKFIFDQPYATIDFEAFYQDVYFDVVITGWAQGTTANPSGFEDAINDFISVGGGDASLFRKLPEKENSVGSSSFVNYEYSLSEVAYGQVLNTNDAGYKALQTYLGGTKLYNQGVNLSAVIKDGGDKGLYYQNNAVAQDIYEVIIGEGSSYDGSLESMIAEFERQYILMGTPQYEKVNIWNAQHAYKTTALNSAGEGKYYLVFEQGSITCYQKLITEGTNATKIYSNMVLYKMYEVNVYNIADLNVDGISSSGLNPDEAVLGDTVELVYTFDSNYSQNQFDPTKFLINGEPLTIGAGSSYDCEGLSGLSITVSTETTEVFGDATLGSVKYNCQEITITINSINQNINSITYSGDVVLNTYNVVLPEMGKNKTFDYGTFYASDGGTKAETALEKNFKFDAVTHGSSVRFFFDPNAAFSAKTTGVPSLYVSLKNGSKAIKFSPVQSIEPAGAIWLQYNTNTNEYFIKNVIDEMEIKFMNADDTEAGLENLFVINSYRIDSTANYSKYYSFVNTSASSEIEFATDATFEVTVNAAYTNTTPIMKIFTNNVIVFANKYFASDATSGTARVKYNASSEVEITLTAGTGASRTYTYRIGEVNYTVETEDSITYTFKIDGELIGSYTISGNKYAVTLKSLTQNPQVWFAGSFVNTTPADNENEQFSTNGWVRNLYTIKLPIKQSDGTYDIFDIKYKGVSITTTASNGNEVKLHHGDMLEFNLIMGAAYTQTLPIFEVSGDVYNLNTRTGVDTKVEPPYDEDGTITWEITENGYIFKVELTYKLDKTHERRDSLDGSTIIFKDRYGSKYKNFYVNATYKVSIEVVGDITLHESNKNKIYSSYDTNGVNYSNSDINKYIVTLNRGTEETSNKWINSGPLVDIQDSDPIKKQHFYVLVPHGALFKDYNPINSAEYDQSGTPSYRLTQGQMGSTVKTIEGSDGEGNPIRRIADWYKFDKWTGEKGSASSFAISTATVTSNLELLVPFNDELYTMKLNKDNLDDGIGDYNIYGALSSDKENSTIGFSKTDDITATVTMRVAYDQYVPHFIVPVYGKVLYPNILDHPDLTQEALSIYTDKIFLGSGTSVKSLTGGVGYYYNAVNAENTAITYQTKQSTSNSLIYITCKVNKNTETGAVTSIVYTYYSVDPAVNNSADVTLFTITQNLNARASANRQNDIASISYTIDFVSEFDAGDTNTNMYFGVDVTDIALNTYKIEYYKQKFNTNTDSSYGYAFTYNEIASGEFILQNTAPNNWTETVTHGSVTVNHTSDKTQSASGYVFNGWKASATGYGSSITWRDWTVIANNTSKIYDNTTLKASFSLGQYNLGYADSPAEYRKQDDTLVAQFTTTTGMANIKYIIDNNNDGINEDITVVFKTQPAFTQAGAFTFKFVDYTTNQQIPVSSTSNTHTDDASLYYTYTVNEGVYTIKIKYLNCNAKIALHIDENIAKEELGKNGIDTWQKYIAELPSNSQNVDVYQDMSYSSRYEYNSGTNEFTFVENIEFSNIKTNGTFGTHFRGITWGNTIADEYGSDFDPSKANYKLTPSVTSPENWIFDGWYIAAVRAEGESDELVMGRAVANVKAWYNAGYVDSSKDSDPNSVVGNEFDMEYTPIEGDYIVVPFFERKTHTVTIVEINSEGNRNNHLGLLEEYDPNYEGEFTFDVPHGYSLAQIGFGGWEHSFTMANMFDKIKSGTITQELEDPTSEDDRAIFHYILTAILNNSGNPVNINSTGTGFNLENYLTKLGGDNYVNRLTYLMHVINSITIEHDQTIYLDYSRDVYQITLMTANIDGENVFEGYGVGEPKVSVINNKVSIIDGVLHIPYMEEIPSDFLAIAMDGLEGHIGQGQHLEDWNYNNAIGLYEIGGIVKSMRLYADIYNNVYNVSVSTLNGTGVALYSNGTAFEVGANGYFNVNYATPFIVKFTPNEGYDRTIPTVRIKVDGVEISLQDFLTNYQAGITVDANTYSNYKPDQAESIYHVRFGQNAMHANHNARVEIIVEGVINSYEVNNWAFGEQISVDDGGHYLTKAQTSELSFLNSGNISMIIFTPSNVTHGGKFTLTLTLAQRYAERSVINFSITDGYTTTQYRVDGALAPNTTIEKTTSEGDMKFNIYEFVFDGVVNDLTVTLGSSEFLSNEYDITFHVYYGGGINGWTDLNGRTKPGTTDKYYDFAAIRVKSVAGSVTLPDNVELVMDNYTINPYSSANGWLVAIDPVGINLSELTSADIASRFVKYDDQPEGGFKSDAHLYYFFDVHQKDVTITETNNLKGSFTEYTDKADVFTDANSSIGAGYKFSYEIAKEYTQNIPVISVISSGIYDLVLVKEDVLKTMAVGATKQAVKSETAIYNVTRTENGYSYALATALGSNTGYIVIVNDGAYTFSYNSNNIATMTIDNNKYTVTLAEVSENFTLAVNDTAFVINAYTIKFVLPDGSEQVREVEYGSAVADIPTATTNIIQKLVYVVTLADGTKAEYSAKGIKKLQFIQDATIEVKVELNIVILIVLVVAALVVVGGIVIVIVVLVKKRSYTKRDKKSNTDMFDKLNQAKKTPEAGNNTTTSSVKNPYKKDNNDTTKQ